MNAYQITPIAQQGADLRGYVGAYYANDIPEDTEFWQYIAAPVEIRLAANAVKLASKIYQRRTGRKAANLKISLVDGGVKITGGEGKIFKYGDETWPVIFLEGIQAEEAGLIEITKNA